MSIKEIERVYSLYEINSLLANDWQHSPITEGALFPDRIQPPSAFIADEQTISNMTNPRT